MESWRSSDNSRARRRHARQHTGDDVTIDRRDAAAPASGPAAPRACPEPPVRRYDALLLDLDGVVYVGPQPVPGAAESIAAARDAGARVAFVTNNASRTPAATAARLAGLGVPASGADVVTSAQAAARLIAERVPSGAAVLVCGGTGLWHALREHGLRPVSTVTDAPAAVVQGYDARLGYGALAEAALAVSAGALFVAANVDTTMPSPRGELPGNGSLVQVVAHATGREPIVAGKPAPPLHRESMLRTGAHRPLVVGDRLDTDIEGAWRGGVGSLLVLTGVTDPVTAALAPPRHRPTYLAADLSGLLVAHPAVDPAGEGFRCGGWTVTRRGNGVDIAGAGDPCDGLRALCACCWTAADAGEPVEADAAGDAAGRIGLPAGHR